jgi:hypothetical protein
LAIAPRMSPRRRPERCSDRAQGPVTRRHPQDEGSASRSASEVSA